MQACGLRADRDEAEGLQEFMANVIDTFVSSLELEEPPPFATPLLRAVWHGLRGDWNTAHEMAQAQAGEDGAWVHAWLHRIEGDQGNADYWYRRARRQSFRGDTRDEGLEIAAALIGRTRGP
jgi:hypothetical protein